MIWWLIAVLLAISVIVIGIERRRAHPAPRIPFRVDTDDTGIVAILPNGFRRTLAWTELRRVTIRTTDEGPFATDVYWEFHASGPAVALAVPGGALGESELLRALGSRLPGFRHEEVVRAMGSTSNDSFVVWEAQREAGPARGAAR